MSEQPGERLARIKRENPLWSIRHVTKGSGFTAHRGARRIWAATLSDLESRLRDADHGPRVPGGRVVAPEGHALSRPLSRTGQQVTTGRQRPPTIPRAFRRVVVPSGIAGAVEGDRPRYVYAGLSLRWGDPMVA